MSKSKIKKIDFSRARIAALADKYYNEGNHLAALRLAYTELEKFGGDGDVFTRLSDIYESMGLHGSAVNWWYRFLDIATEDDLPDIYEGLAVNYLSMGNEAQAAFYYNRLIDSDDLMPNETKMDIAAAFSHEKKSRFRNKRLPLYTSRPSFPAAFYKAAKQFPCSRPLCPLPSISRQA